MADQRCDDCANRGPWRAAYSKVPTGPQGFAVADCPHAYPGTAVSPGSGSHCPSFTRTGDMRAEFMAWVRDRGCDTDGAWSAWQACWNLRTSIGDTPAPQSKDGGEGPDHG